MSPSDSSARVLPWLLFIAILSSGCVNAGLKEYFRPYEYESIPEPLPPQPTEGAIWTGARASGSFLFFDRKARGIGDLVTVRVVENATATGKAETSLGKDSGYTASLSSNVGFTELLQDAYRKVFTSLGVEDPVNEVGAGESLGVVTASRGSDFEGEGETKRSGSFVAVVTCRVVAVLPNGLMHVRGRRSLVVNHEIQLITVEGLIRPQDLSMENTIASTAIADAKITYDGVGVIDEKQRPGFFQRLMDWTFPF